LEELAGGADVVDDEVLDEVVDGVVDEEPPVLGRTALVDELDGVTVVFTVTVVFWHTVQGIVMVIKEQVLQELVTVVVMGWLTEVI
jgi:hypothetical protein